MKIEQNLVVFVKQDGNRKGFLDDEDVEAENHLTSSGFFAPLPKLLMLTWLVMQNTIFTQGEKNVFLRPFQKQLVHSTETTHP